MQHYFAADVVTNANKIEKKLFSAKSIKPNAHTKHSYSILFIRSG